MVASLTLTFDIASIAVSTAVPGVAWALLLGVSWGHPEFAESLGLGRTTFWLLLPGAILASFALLPIVPVSDDILAVSFAGGVFPLLVGALALERIEPALRRIVGRLFLPLGIETAALLGVVGLADDGALATVARSLRIGPWATELGLVTLVASAATAIVVLASRGEGSGARGLAGIFGLTTAVAVLTFAGSTAIPGVGIAEGFPYYLVPPILVGGVAVLLGPRLFPGAPAFALTASFFAAAWGVVLGADVLWQPPLYGTGPAGLYAIGGAGVLDLVYLSAFLGLLGAWGAHRLLRRGFAPVGTPLPPPAPSPGRDLRAAFAMASEGSVTASLTASAAAARGAALEAHRLLGSPVPDPQRPWIGLPVPGWVVSDQANLESMARAGSDQPTEAWRAFATARSLVRLGEAIERPRFASIAERLAAFAVDAALLGVAGAAVFAGIALLTAGGLNALLASVPFNAAIYGFVAIALVYLAAGEHWTGTTVGKALLGLEVRDRALARPGGVAALTRNAPLLPVMTLYAIGLALALAVAMRGIPAGASLGVFGVGAGTLAIVSIGAVVLVGVGLAGTVGIAMIAATRERQRVGDLWADTWVVRRLTRAPRPPSPAAAAARSS